MDLELKYTSEKKDFSISLFAKDILGLSIPKAKSVEAGQSFSITTGIYSRSLGLNLSYRFGGFKAKEHKAVDTSRFGL